MADANVTSLVEMKFGCVQRKPGERARVDIHATFRVTGPDGDKLGKKHNVSDFDYYAGKIKNAEFDYNFDVDFGLDNRATIRLTADWTLVCEMNIIDIRNHAKQAISEVIEDALVVDCDELARGMTDAAKHEFDDLEYEIERLVEDTALRAAEAFLDDKGLGYEQVGDLASYFAEGFEITRGSTLASSNMLDISVSQRRFDGDDVMEFLNDV